MAHKLWDEKHFLTLWAGSVQKRAWAGGALNGQHKELFQILLNSKLNKSFISNPKAKPHCSTDYWHCGKDDQKEREANREREVVKLYKKFLIWLVLQNWVFLPSTKIHHHNNSTSLESITRKTKIGGNQNIKASKVENQRKITFYAWFQ